MLSKIYKTLPRTINILLVILFICVVVGGFLNRFNLSTILLLVSPAVIMIALTILSWKRPKIGGGFLLALGVIVSFLLVQGTATVEWTPLLVFGFPLMLSGAMQVFGSL
jgi:hypothetical protein